MSKFILNIVFENFLMKSDKKLLGVFATSTSWNVIFSLFTKIIFSLDLKGKVWECTKTSCYWWLHNAQCKIPACKIPLKYQCKTPSDIFSRISLKSAVTCIPDCILNRPSQKNRHLALASGHNLKYVKKSKGFQAKAHVALHFQ